MPLLYANFTNLYKTIGDIAAEFQNPKGQPWQVAEIPSTMQSKFKIRAWDAYAKTEHRCWIMFEAVEVNETAVVDVSMCQRGHYVSKFHQTALTTLIHRFGLPPNRQAEDSTIPGPTPGQPAPPRASMSPLSRPPAVRPKIHPAFLKRPPTQQ